MRQASFIGGSYESRSPNVAADKCVNLYPEITESGTGKHREVGALVSRPGLSLLATAGVGPIRGIYQTSKATTFCVSGQELYNVTTPTTPVLVGTINTATGPVSMADNGVEMVLVDGDKGYHFNFATSVFAQITDPEFPRGANVIQFLDQYLIANEPGTARFWYSKISDGTSWDGLDFASAEGSPDKLITLLVDHRELFLFGEHSTEIFFNTGDADNPFQRIQGAFIEQGIAAAATAKKIDNSPFWLGKDVNGQGMVWRALGYQGKRVSTHAVEHAIAGYGDLSGATGYTYQWKGHSFYAINFPYVDTTWVFDISTSLWHEETSRRSNGNETRHRIEHHAFNGSQHLAGDFENGRLYEMRDDIYSDAGTTFKRMRRTPHIANEGKKIFFAYAQIDIESGVGLATGQGSDPQMMLRYSDDGGHTWSNEKWTSMGLLGNTLRRAIWRRLGSCRDRVVEISSTEPVKQVWISGLGMLSGGTH